MNKLLFASVEDGPVVRRYFWCGLVNQSRISLDPLLHFEVDNAAQLDGVFRLVNKEVVCNVFAANIHFFFHSSIEIVGALKVLSYCHDCRGEIGGTGCRGR